MFEVINAKKLLTEEERFLIIHSKKVNPEVIEYLKSLFHSLTIEIGGDYEGSILELMHLKKLKSWAWQTTESAIVFFDEVDYIERGYLKFSEDKNYYHAWICFMFQSELYVFDPCLGLICKKELFFKVFEPIVVGRTTAKEVREELIYRINYPKIKKISEEEKWMQDFLSELCPNAVQMQDRETIIDGDEDVNSTMYRNHTCYIADMEDGQIRKLAAHFYNNKC